MKPDSASLLKLLGDPCRLKIMCLLAQGEHTNESLASTLKFKDRVYNYHLEKLRERGVLASRRCGRVNRYSLYDPSGSIVRLLVELHLQFDPRSAQADVEMPQKAFVDKRTDEAPGERRLVI